MQISWITPSFHTHATPSRVKPGSMGSSIERDISEALKQYASVDILENEEEKHFGTLFRRILFTKMHTLFNMADKFSTGSASNAIGKYCCESRGETGLNFYEEALKRNQ